MKLIFISSLHEIQNLISENLKFGQNVKDDKNLKYFNLVFITIPAIITTLVSTISADKDQ